MVKKALTNKASNQRSNWTNKDVMIRERYSALNKIRKLPKVRAQFIMFAFEYNMHKHRILTPSISFRTQPR